MQGLWRREKGEGNRVWTLPLSLLMFREARLLSKDWAEGALFPWR